MIAIRKYLLNLVLSAFLIGCCVPAIHSQDDNKDGCDKKVITGDSNKTKDDPYNIESSENGPTKGVVYTRDAMGNKVPVDTQKTGEMISCDEPL